MWLRPPANRHIKLTNEIMTFLYINPIFFTHIEIRRSMMASVNQRDSASNTLTLFRWPFSGDRCSCREEVAYCWSHCPQVDRRIWHHWSGRLVAATDAASLGWTLTTRSELPASRDAMMWIIDSLLHEAHKYLSVACNDHIRSSSMPRHHSALTAFSRLHQWNTSLTSWKSFFHS